MRRERDMEGAEEEQAATGPWGRSRTFSICIALREELREWEPQQAATLLTFTALLVGLEEDHGVEVAEAAETTEG